MAEPEDGFLTRWARRKQEDKEQDSGAEREQSLPDSRKEVSGQEISEQEQAEIVAKLPDIDSLDQSSDFSVFMQKGVPELIRRKALRKLWRLNPIHGFIDGMDDYAEDFADTANLAQNVTSIFKAGKGMRAEDSAEAMAQAETPPEAKPEHQQEEDSAKPAEGPAAQSESEAQARQAEEEDVGLLEETREEEAALAQAVEPPQRDEVRVPGSAVRRRWGSVEG